MPNTILNRDGNPTGWAKVPTHQLEAVARHQSHTETLVVVYGLDTQRRTYRTAVAFFDGTEVDLPSGFVRRYGRA